MKCNERINIFTLVLFCSYLILGNLPRVIKFIGFSDNMLLTEILIYLTTVVVISMNYKYYFNLLKDEGHIWKLNATIIIFSVMGLAYHKGSNIEALIYAVRIVMQLLFSLVIGGCLWKIFKKDVRKTMFFYVIIFFTYTLFGWIIYAVSPYSDKLWADLAKVGIVFGGDPHIGRFIGTYFDPNFTSNILILPNLFSIYLYLNEEKNKYKYIYLSLIMYFVVCILYTYSRSGLLGLIISGVILLGNYFIECYRSNKKIDVRIYYGVAFGAISLIILIIFDNDTVMRMLGRFNNILGDPSAQHRFYDLFKGFNFFKSSIYIFLFGIGYNYVKFDLGTSLNALDSSILNTLICFGIVGSGLLCKYMFGYLKALFKNLFKIEPKLVIYIIAYIISIVVICNFNNVLYYQFFIVATGSFLNYLVFLKE